MNITNNTDHPPHNIVLKQQVCLVGGFFSYAATQNDKGNHSCYAITFHNDSLQWLLKYI